jgi:hypothetical protein
MATSPRRILVIANETVASTSVSEEVRYRAGGAGAEVMVVAPALASSRLGHWLSSDIDAAREQAADRLRASVAALNAAGLEASGELGDGDPLQALDDAFRIFDPDEVIISTHPPSRSTWLERRVVRRARQRYEVPITHIVVDLEHEEAKAEDDARHARHGSGPGPRLRLYHHATSYEDALAIASEGFRDGYGATETGVLLTDRPAPEEDATGFMLDIPEEVAAPYEQPGNGEEGRTFVLPAALLNRYGPPVASGDWSE